MTMVEMRFIDRHGDLLEAWPRVLPHVQTIAAGDASYTPDDLRDSLARGEQRLLVMEEGGKLLGFAVVGIVQYPREKYLREAHVWVLPEERGKGLFDRYLLFLRRWARDHGFAGTLVALPVDAEPRWRPLMESHGFAPRTIEYVWEATPCRG